MAAATGPKQYPPLEAGDYARGALMGLWVMACALALSVAARAGACGDPAPLAEAYRQVWSDPAGCPGVQLVGAAVVLVPRTRPGMIFGLFADASGPVGQLVGLGLLAAATVAAILVIRWRWRTPGDALALGGLWGGLLVHAAPRLAGPGHTFTDLFVAGATLSVADVAIAFCGLWLLWRLVAELRA